MLRESNLLQQLMELMPEANGNVFSLYGDPAYPQSMWIFGGYRFPEEGSDEARWNTFMSKVREVVEWGFKDIKRQWSYLNFRDSMKIFEVPIGMYYTIGAFLCNLRSTMYGNETACYFDCATMSLNEYLSLIDD